MITTPFRLICSIICCLVVLFIIAVGIFAAVVASQFKVPAVTFPSTRPVGTPSFSMNPLALSMKADTEVKIENSGLEFEIKGGKAYVALEQAAEVDAGQADLPNVKIVRGSTTFTTRVDFKYDKTNDPDGKLIRLLMERCRPGGQPLDAIYKLDMWVKVYGISFPIPRVTHKMKQDCPFDLTTIPNIDQLPGQLQRNLGL